jgi:hypothetical protein
MNTNQPTDQQKKKINPGPTTTPDANEAPKKHKKDPDDDTRNTGFRSSRIRESESRTSETGDPSIP